MFIQLLMEIDLLEDLVGTVGFNDDLDDIPLLPAMRIVVAAGLASCMGEMCTVHIAFPVQEFSQNSCLVLVQKTGYQLAFLLIKFPCYSVIKKGGLSFNQRSSHAKNRKDI